MEKYIFSNENIAQVCGQVWESMKTFDVERREGLRLKLVLEEVLLEYQEKFGEKAEFFVRCIKRFSTIKIEVIVKGESFNPLDKDGEESEVIQSLLAGIGLVPTWSYKKGKNHVIFTPKKKPFSGTMKIVAAIGAAIIAGMILNLLPDGIRIGVNDYMLTPMTDAFMGLISAVSGPLW